MSEPYDDPRAENVQAAMYTLQRLAPSAEPVQACLRDTSGWQLNVLAKWIQLLKSLEGKSVKQVELSNVLHPTDNPDGDLLTIHVVTE